MTPTFDNQAQMPNRGAMSSIPAQSSFLKGFFAFDQLITTRVVKIIYIIGLVLIPLATIGSSAAMFLFLLFNGGVSGSSMISGFFQLIVSVVASLVGILLLRIYCEFIIVIFRINENLQAIRDHRAQF